MSTLAEFSYAAPSFPRNQCGRCLINMVDVYGSYCVYEGLVHCLSASRRRGAVALSAVLRLSSQRTLVLPQPTTICSNFGQFYSLVPRSDCTATFASFTCPLQSALVL